MSKEERRAEATKRHDAVMKLRSDLRANSFAISVELKAIHDENLYEELVPEKTWKAYVKKKAQLSFSQISKWIAVVGTFTQAQVEQVGMEVLYLYENHCRLTKTPIASDLSTVKVQTPRGSVSLPELSVDEAEAAFPRERHTSPRKPSSSNGDFGGWETWADQGGLGPAHTYAAVIENTVRDEGVAPIIEAKPGKDGTRLVIDIEMRRFPDLVRAFAAHLKEFGVPDLKKDSANVRIPKLKDATPKGTPSPKPAKKPAKKKVAEKR